MLLAVADVLIDAASVLGGDATLKILYMKFVEVGSICIFGICSPSDKILCLLTAILGSCNICKTPINK